MKFLFFVLSLFVFSYSAYAQKVLVDDKGQPQEVKEIPTGKKAADKYMNRKTEGGGSIFSGDGSHYLSLHIGPYVDSDIHRWGANSPKNDGIGMLGVTYRVGEWTNSSDFLFRVSGDFVEINNKDTAKIALMPIWAFPDARANFPLYFGAGLGLGIFTNQVDSESKLSLDYAILAGARFFNVIDNIGLMFEVGINNHIFLTSTGQFSGTYIVVGTVFQF